MLRIATPNFERPIHQKVTLDVNYLTNVLRKKEGIRRSKVTFCSVSFLISLPRKIKGFKMAKKKKDNCQAK